MPGAGEWDSGTGHYRGHQLQLLGKTHTRVYLLPSHDEGRSALDDSHWLSFH